MALPNQLVIPGMDAALGDASPKLGDVPPDEIVEATEAPIAGQGHLFALPRPVVQLSTQRTASPTQRGASGHRIFIGHCLSAGLNVQENPDPGHAGDDCWVEGYWVQIKTTGILQADGRLKFYAGKRGRFALYTDIDYFAFVVIGVPGLHARVAIIEGGMVRNRWPGPAVSLTPIDFPNHPDLSLLTPTVTDEMIDELVREERAAG